MKKILLALLFLFPRPAFSALTVVATGSGGSTDGINVTVTINAAGADLIVWETSFYGNATFCSFTDSQSLTWSQISSHGDPSFNSWTIVRFAAGASIGVASQSFSCNGGSSYPSISVIALSGSNTAMALDQSTTANSSSTNALAVGPVTPTSANQIVIASAASSDTVNSITCTCGTLTALPLTGFVSGQHLASSMGYQIQTTATAATATFNLASATSAAADIATFRSIAVAAGGPKPGTLVTLGVGK